MNFEVRDTVIPGCCEITPRIFRDERGLFVKTYQRDYFEKTGLATCYAEEYYSYSRQGVLRGLHFQLPPSDHAKLVYCVAGEVMDAVVDLRVGSPSYGCYSTVILSSTKANMLYIPPGLAHGFYVTSESVTMMYKVTSIYSPEHDTGILWDSVGIPWPNPDPVVSDRDRDFLPLSEFASPFTYTGDGR